MMALLGKDLFFQPLTFPADAARAAFSKEGPRSRWADCNSR